MKKQILAAIGKVNIKRVYRFTPKKQVTVETWLTLSELQEKVKDFPNVLVYEVEQELFLNSIYYSCVRFTEV